MCPIAISDRSARQTKFAESCACLIPGGSERKMPSRRATPSSKRKSKISSKRISKGSEARLLSDRPQNGRKLAINKRTDFAERAPYLLALLENNPLATLILDTKHRVRMC